MSNKSTIQKQSSELVQNIVDCALEKKAEKLLVLDVYNLTTLADYFIICSANTEPQIKAICDNIRRGTPHKPWHIEGKTNSDWILLDYINVVGHIFYKEARSFYDIEELWSDANRINVLP